MGSALPDRLPAQIDKQSSSSRKGGAYIGINVGLVNENRDCCWIGSTLIGHDGASVIAQGAGNFVSMKDIVAQGGAKLIGSDGAGVVAQGAGNVVAQGAGNLRQLLAAGQTGFQFPNRYAIVSGPQPQAAKPSTPNIGGSSGHSDESILLCINSQSSALRQIRAADGGANHITLTVSSGIATFTGNVLSQSSKNTLTSAATNCGARTVNANGLRIGK